MNIVIVYGKIVSKIDFKFIYSRYKTEKEYNSKYKHTSIVRFKIKLLDNNLIEVYGYDNIADYIYRNLKENDIVLIYGKLDSNLKINIEYIEK